jgi:hypothetical protein
MWKCFLRVGIGDFQSERYVMQEEGDLQTPFELSPVPHMYVVIASGVAIGFPAIFWMLATTQGKTASIQSMAIAPAAIALMLLYVKSVTVRLGDTGISKGLPVLGVLIPYERVAGVSKEVLIGRGNPAALVVSEQDSGRRIVIRLQSFDRADTARMMAELARRAPQAQIEGASYIQLQR